MSKPLTVTVPHKLGKDEAVRRLKTGLGTIRDKFGHLIRIDNEAWAGDRLTFQISALGQSASGTVDVFEQEAVIEVQLPWLLHRIAERATGLIRKEGTLLLEKKP
ncbi:MAG: polyhydroxyalkanoic acid system family protein [Parvibaculaceae bacterium]